MTGAVFFGPTPGPYDSVRTLRGTLADPDQQRRRKSYNIALASATSLIKALEDFETFDHRGHLAPAGQFLVAAVDETIRAFGVLQREVSTIVQQHRDGATVGELQVQPGVIDPLPDVGVGVGQRDSALRLDVPQVPTGVQPSPDDTVQSVEVGVGGQLIADAAVSEVDGHPGSLGATTGPVVDAGISEAEVKRLASEAIAGHLADEPNCELCAGAADKFPPNREPLYDHLPMPDEFAVMETRLHQEVTLLRRDLNELLAALRGAK